MSESVVAQLDNMLQRLDVLRALERDNEITRLRARVEMLEGLAHQSLTVLQCSDDHSEHWCAHCDDNIGGSHIVALRAALEAKP